MDRIDVGTLAQTDRLALFDVAESGTCPAWFDADGYKPACLLGCVGSQGQRFLKSLSIYNHVIGGKNDHDGCVIANCHPAGAERDGSSGVAFGRLRYNVFLWKIPEQFANGAFLLRVRQDQNALGRDKAFQACQSFFEQSFVGDEAQKLFGTGPPAQWPKAFAASTGEDERVDQIGHVESKMGGFCRSRKLPFLFSQTRRIW